MATPKYNLSKLKGKLIAIDGPAGSGKSTTARMVAEKLGFVYLDTGAMYRAVTLFAMRNGVSLDDENALAQIASRLPIEFKSDDDVQRVLVKGEDVTDEIRTPEVTKNVSKVSAYKGVREAMVAKQREIGKNGSIVAEGRDTTTVVFPDADVKVYMEASTRERAQRRLLDLAKLGVTTTVDDQEEAIVRRDKYDSGREHSPLTRSRDAYVIDTTNVTIEEQVERVIQLILSTLK